jgi:hypothetical protein
VARAYLDQLVRDTGLPVERTTAIGRDLDAAERLTGADRSAAFTRLGTQLDADAAQAADARRVTAMSGVVKALAAAGPATASR